MTASNNLSVIIVPLLGPAALAGCLDMLPLSTIECIVVSREPICSGLWPKKYPCVRFVDASGMPVPLRRQRGIEAAGGEFVALLEDTAQPLPGWCDAVRAAFVHPRVAAVGGPVRISTELPSRFQALGWSEYGVYGMKPIQGKLVRGRTVVSRLPGNNIAFRRLELIDALRGQTDGLVEGVIYETLRERGFELLFDPEMSVNYVAPDRHSAALATRMHHGRIYGAGRARRCSWPQRLGFVAKSALLPVVLSFRTLSAAFGSVPPATLPAVAFWVFVMESAWAVGEAVGYVAGPGSSMERWR